MTTEGKGDTMSQSEEIDEELEELKKKFIIDSGDFDSEEIKKYLTIILKFCKITSDGGVILIKTKLTNKEKIGIIILARYLGNKLNETIAEAISWIEVSKYSNIEKKSVSARASDLQNEGFISKESEGIYKFNSIMIGEFLEILSSMGVK